MTTIQEHLAYYEATYNPVAVWVLRRGDKVVLGNRDRRVCRFCGRTRPVVTFRMDAHALPESIGNKGLMTLYECDSCNQAFGEGCENDFGNWSLPMRTMTRISGKSGVPSLKLGPGNTWRIDQTPTGLKINVDETEGFLKDDPENKTLSFRLNRAPYRPSMVAQAFFKMALSIMPEGELVNFQDILVCIRPGTSKAMFANAQLIHTFVGGSWPRDLLRVSLLIRKSDDMLAPYCLFQLGVGNEFFQLPIPSNAMDRHLHGQRLSLPIFPFCDDENVVRAASVRTLPLDKHEWVKNDTVEITLSYGNRMDNPAR